jgi:hypothetical protein
MKVIAIFMTLLILLSGFDFCTDNEGINVGSKEKTSLVKTAKAGTDKNEVCSPFCQCARCPFSVLLPSTQPSVLAYKPLKNKFSLTIAGDPTGVSGSVWQPPKVA